MKRFLKVFVIAIAIFGLNNAYATYGWGKYKSSYKSYSKFSSSKSYSYKKTSYKSYKKPSYVKYKKPVYKKYTYKKPSYTYSKYSYKKPKYTYKKYVYKKYVKLKKKLYKIKKRYCKNGGYKGGYHGWGKKKCNASPHW